MSPPDVESQPSVRDREIAAVVIGGSAGALDVLRTLLRPLPASIGVPIVVVLHLPERSPDRLHEVFNAGGALLAKYAEDKEPIRSGTVYVAPSGYHLLIETHRAFALSVDEPMHYSRPSIDVLFESACDAYADGLLGILLSGASEDGAAGIHAIHTAGGITIVQSPASAETVVMPASALGLFNPTYVLPPTQIATVVLQLLAAPGSSRLGEQ
jgi:two-component system chemotaxis response regulator CheB